VQNHLYDDTNTGDEADIQCLPECKLLVYWKLILNVLLLEQLSLWPTFLINGVNLSRKDSCDRKCSYAQGHRVFSIKLERHP
jgi:hypothetical protein